MDKLGHTFTYMPWIQFGKYTNPIGFVKYGEPNWQQIGLSILLALAVFGVFYYLEAAASTVSDSSLTKKVSFVNVEVVSVTSHSRHTAVDHDISERNGTVKRRKSLKQALVPSDDMTTPSGKKVRVRREKHEDSTPTKPITPSTGTRAGLRGANTGLLETPDGRRSARLLTKQ